MVHLYGAEYLLAREEYSRQYQTRLDVHGIGITAVELLCSVALAARKDGAPKDSTDRDGHWDRLMDAWQTYHATVGNWWEMIYSVFSVGGDFRPMHSWLVQEAVADQVVALLADIRQALRECAAHSDRATNCVLRVLAELTDEASTLGLLEACALLEGEDPDLVEALELARRNGHGAIPTHNGDRDNAGGTVEIPRPTSTLAVMPVAVEETPTLLSVARSRKSSTATVDAGAGARLADVAAVGNHVGLAGDRNGGVPGPGFVQDHAGEKYHDDRQMLPCMTCVSQQENGGFDHDYCKAAALATAAAEESRRALESLAPIPVLSAAFQAPSAERGRQMSRRSRQVEVAELKEAQLQLRRDLEQLQRVKLRLQHARQIHEEARQFPLRVPPGTRRHHSRDPERWAPPIVT